MLLNNSFVSLALTIAVILGIGVIATIGGRYYAMDRDNNYDRLKLAYDAIVSNIGDKYNTPEEMFDKSYSNDVTDEFIKYCKPLILGNPEIITEDGIPKHITR